MSDGGSHLETDGEKIDYKFAPFGRDQLDILTKSLRSGRLITHLDFWGSNIPSSLLRDLFSVLGDRTSLKVVDFGDNSLGDPSCKLIADFLSRSRVQVLILDRNALTDSGGPALLRTLKTNRHLQTLSLRHNQLGNAFAAELATVFETNSVLKSVILYHNAIGNAGVRALAATIEQSRSIISLDLRCNLFTCKVSQSKITEVCERNAPVMSTPPRTLAAVAPASAVSTSAAKRSPELRSLGASSLRLPAGFAMPRQQQQRALTLHSSDAASAVSMRSAAPSADVQSQLRETRSTDNVRLSAPLAARIAALARDGVLSDATRSDSDSSVSRTPSPDTYELVQRTPQVLRATAASESASATAMARDRPRASVTDTTRQQEQDVDVEASNMSIDAH